MHPAEPFKLPVLQHAQKFWLQLEWQLSNLIQKQRPFVGQLDASRFLADRAGESTFLMPEQFALQQPREGTAAQLSLMNVLSRRALSECTERATNSFPVPVSPKSKTVESVGAAARTFFKTSRSEELCPMISSKPNSV